MEKEQVGFTTQDWTKFPILGPQLVEFDRLTESEGLPQAAEKILDDRGLFVTNIFEPKETFDTLSEKPALIIALHPQHDVDGLSLVASIPKKRHDVFVIASAGFLGFPPYLRERVIPIYGLSHKPTNSLRLKIWRHLQMDSQSPRQSARFNSDSLDVAAQQINDGHLVTIFPETSEGNWYPGVGKIIKKVVSEEARIIFVSIHGTSAIDKYRILPAAKALLPPTTVSVTFSAPFCFTDFIEGCRDRKEIVERVQGEYEKFISISGPKELSGDLFETYPQTGQSKLNSFSQA